ncbi:MAG: hypothetical protein F6K62_06135 [Sphaerospermopsis sp. SIO1G2]|nr:hypothetical protein [Sphaerospermopsis sp. SIO1G2]
MPNKEFGIKMGTWIYGWSAPEKAYQGIGSSLGVDELKGGEKNVVRGANFPKPPVVNISYTSGSGKNEKTSSVTRFCSPDRIGDVLDGSLRGKTIQVDDKSYKIKSVALKR